MNRRAFLSLLTTGLIGSTLDVEKLLWIPGKKKIFIPNKISLYGVPYHMNNGVVGPWLGLAREQLSAAEIMAITYKSITPKLQELFIKDQVFYEEISKNKY